MRANRPMYLDMIFRIPSIAGIRFGLAMNYSTFPALGSYSVSTAFRCFLSKMRD
jgi:hypothetical protein